MTEYIVVDLSADMVLYGLFMAMVQLGILVAVLVIAHMVTKQQKAIDRDIAHIHAVTSAAIDNMHRVRG